MLRLFVALEIPDFAKSELILLRDGVVDNPGLYKWETPDKMHLTLKFLGDVPEQKLDEIISVLDFLHQYKPFECSFRTFDFFFRHKQPVILWAGIRVPKELIDIAGKLNERMEQFGIQPEKRKFKPHLTLLRIKRGVSEKFVQDFRDMEFEPIRFTSRNIVLYQSILKPTGAVYKARKTFHLEEK